MTVESETLDARVVRLAATNNLTVADVNTLVTAMGVTGCPADTHQYSSDAAVLALMTKLGVTAAPAENLNGPGPKDPAFRAFLGSLANSFDTMKPERRLALWREWSQRKAAPDRIQVLQSELTTRYGSIEAADRKMTTMEKLRVAHAADATTKPLKTAPVRLTPALATLPVHRRLEATHAIAEYARIKDSNREFDQTRARAMMQRWGAGILVA